MVKTHSILKPEYLIILLFMCAVYSLRGQTLYVLKIDQNIRNEAKEITAEYQPRLVMGADQALEFQSTVAKYLVKKRAIEQDSTLSPKAKYNWLKRLSSRETSDMADVLELYRLQEYTRIKPQIQPLPGLIEYKENLMAQEKVGID